MGSTINCITRLANYKFHASHVRRIIRTCGIVNIISFWIVMPRVMHC